MTSSDPIRFQVPTMTGAELTTMSELLAGSKFCGDGPWTKKCHLLLDRFTGAKKSLLTTSCTHALEMSAILADIQAGDEVIMPSFTFVSTANAFALRGAKIVFVDIRPETMNLDEEAAQNAVTTKTRAILAVHYGGVGVDMEKLQAIQHTDPKIRLIEDAAQGIGATLRGRPLGSWGDFGCLSFHETKNLQCGEGGALLINRESDFLRAEIVREKGTNRSQFIRGQIDKYTWQDLGSSYLPSELNAAFLSCQLDRMEQITERRRSLWSRYDDGLRSLRSVEIETLDCPPDRRHNGHIFWLKMRSESERDKLIDALGKEGIQATFHYLPLHSSPAGKKFGRFVGADRHTTDGASRLLRLPLFHGMTESQQNRVIDRVLDFVKGGSA